MEEFNLLKYILEYSISIFFLVVVLWNSNLNLKKERERNNSLSDKLLDIIKIVTEFQILNQQLANDKDLKNIASKILEEVKEGSQSLKGNTSRLQELFQKLEKIHTDVIEIQKRHN